MRRDVTAILASLILLLASCASTTSTQNRTEAGAGELQRPARVLVYDFVGTRDALPADSVVAAYTEQRSTPQTQKEIDLGRRLGQLVAQGVVTELTAAGIQAQAAGPGQTTKVGDGVIRGEFIVVNEGSRTARVLIGFGAGAGELKTLAEAYLVTEDGLRRLGDAQVGAAGGKLPGILVPLGTGSSIAGAAGGTANVMQERGPESIDAAAQRTAKEIARQVVDAYRKRGWL
ncbi:MAG TPA: DUF4410 domain-containing protein [Lysobacter sp.]